MSVAVAVSSCMHLQYSRYSTNFTVAVMMMALLIHYSFAALINYVLGPYAGLQ